MFPGMFMKKPDKAAALKQLKSHLAAFGAWVVVLRLITQWFSDSPCPSFKTLNKCNISASSLPLVRVKLETLVSQERLLTTGQFDVVSISFTFDLVMSNLTVNAFLLFL
ncbi:hypothetical protein LIER_17345 [Lithospermum erythrorhizon]|uniref:Uncharacterized protein n=1 Tax=Lithospermum erythrorhizon TaxID=34254 RepID=A0AAV3QFE9_LITER